MLLTVKEVAERLKFHPGTIRQMIQRGELRAVRWANQWRVDERSLSREQAAAPQIRKSRQAQDELSMARAFVGLDGR